jgi:hypothetical protein
VIGGKYVALSNPLGKERILPVGINFHGLAFLKYVANSAPFVRTVTIGRQAIHIDSSTVERLLGPIGQLEKYCESLLCGKLGASEVDSIDYSDFEQATII